MVCKDKGGQREGQLTVTNAENVDGDELADSGALDGHLVGFSRTPLFNTSRRGRRRSAGLQKARTSAFRRWTLNPFFSSRRFQLRETKKLSQSIGACSHEGLGHRYTKCNRLYRMKGDWGND